MARPHGNWQALRGVSASALHDEITIVMQIAPDYLTTTRQVTEGGQGMAQSHYVESLF